MSAAVSIQGVTKRFPGVRGGDDVVAVDALDLEIRDGEFFSLLGPSGCGKTTTLRMIAGFEYPTAGSIRIFGTEVGLEPPNRRPVNTVFQSYALFPHMTVADNIGFGLEMQGVGSDEIRRRVAEVVDLVQLAGREDRKPSQLSGGQQQRVALARALANDPVLILADEPTGNLDSHTEAEVLDLMDELNGEGKAIALVTHENNVAGRAQRVVHMLDGRINREERL